MPFRIRRITKPEVLESSELTGLTQAEEMTVSGNLTVQGEMTSITSNNLEVQDAKVVIAAGTTQLLGTEGIFFGNEDTPLASIKASTSKFTFDKSIETANDISTDGLSVNGITLSGATTLTSVSTDISTASSLDEEIATSKATKTYVDAETSARVAADNSLQANLDTEAATRLTNDTTLQSNLDTEAATRLSEDTTLQSNLDTEAATRLANDTTLQNNIDAEQLSRTTSVALLQSELDVTQTNAGLGTGGIYTANNSTSYLSSATSLKDADEKLDTAVASVQTQLDTEEAARIANDATTLASANSYTDTEIAGLVDSAPATLDTLNELAAALGNDPNLSATLAAQIGELNTDVTDVNTALGIAENDTDFGSFTGSTISDSGTAKAAIQELETAVELKANSASPTLTGTPLAPTATAGTNTTQIATTEFVQSAISTKDHLSELSGNTDDVSEGTTNLYYTDARADGRIAVASVTDLSDVDQALATTDAVTFEKLTIDQSGTDYGMVINQNHANAGLHIDATQNGLVVNSASNSFGGVMFRAYNSDNKGLDIGTDGDSVFSGDITAQGTILLSGTPTSGSHAINKGYVDTVDNKADKLVLLSGVSELDTNLGTFTGSTISDNSNVKQALQSLETDVETKADAVDAALTGTPTAPTASVGTNTTQIATTAFVTEAVAGENTLEEMNDVAITSVADNDVIAYDATASKYVNQSAAEAGLATAADLTTHTSTTSNPHSVTAAQVGLGNCDNTSDADKPVSTAQQSALDLKLSNTTDSIYVDSDNNRVCIHGDKDAAHFNVVGYSHFYNDAGSVRLAIHSGKVIEANNQTHDAIDLRIHGTGKVRVSQYDNGVNALMNFSSSGINLESGLTYQINGQQIAMTNLADGGDYSTTAQRNVVTDALSTSITAEETARIAGDASTLSSAQSYTDTAVANLVDSAPATLDTLNELAAALADDPNFATTITNQVSGVQTNLDTEEAARIAADSTLQTNIDTVASDLASEISTTGGEITSLQTEVDAIETGAGLSASGAYQAGVSANYISSATSLADADDKLDAAIKTEETSRTSADSTLQSNIDTVASNLTSEINTTNTEITALQNDKVDLTGDQTITGKTVFSNSGNTNFDNVAAEFYNATGDALVALVAGNYGRTEFRGGSKINFSNWGRVESNNGDLTLKASTDKVAIDSDIDLASGKELKFNGTALAHSNLSDSADYSTTAQRNAVTDLLAPLASPTLTGTPVAPTATPGTDTTQIATTAFVQAAISTKDHLSELSGDTDSVTEGTTNLYYTDARVQANRLDQMAVPTSELNLNMQAIKFMGSPEGSTDAATKGYVDTEIANLVASAPATLDTLNELAAALGDDPNYATTISTQIGEIDTNVDDVISLTGIAENTTSLGTFSGSTITDSSTIKTALQELETAVETKATSTVVTEIDTNVDNLITAMGATENQAHIGTFTGSTISDNGTMKAGMQELETALELKADIDDADMTGLTTAESVKITVPNNATKPLVISNPYPNQWSIDLTTAAHGVRFISNQTSSGSSIFDLRNGNGQVFVVKNDASITASGTIEAGGLITSDEIVIQNSQTPTSASSTGTKGTICWDANYMYVCVSTNTWKKITIGDW